MKTNYFEKKFALEAEFFTIKIKKDKIVPIDLLKNLKKCKYFEHPNFKKPELRIKIKPEIANELFEINIPPHYNIKKIEDDFKDVMNFVIDFAKKYDARILPAALFPLNFKFTFFNYKRYKFLMKYIGKKRSQKAPFIASDQINIGGENEKDAFKTFNLLRKYLNIFLGFSVASPFFAGKKSNYLGKRMHIYMDVLKKFNPGFPPQMNSLEEYFFQINKHVPLKNPNFYYKFLRPMPVRGVAAEIRVIDKQPTIKESLSFIALCKGLICNQEKIEEPKEYEKEFNQSLKKGIYNIKKFKKIIEIANRGLPKNEKKYLSPLRVRLKKGTIAEKLIYLVEKKKLSISEAYLSLSDALESNNLFVNL